MVTYNLNGMTNLNFVSVAGQLVKTITSSGSLKPEILYFGFQEIIRNWPRGQKKRPMTPNKNATILPIFLARNQAWAALGLGLGWATMRLWFDQSDASASSIRPATSPLSPTRPHAKSRVC